ncbi:MAG: GNAT family N-acetyltransferase [Christensenellales bacterium]|jgi:predicted TIM-barrel fold metal-dependent hydrolase/N-acetylglutamate synthase-like GNAT family acetyltransferase
MYDYFHKTELDKEFYDANLRHRLPDTIIDAHAHFNLKEHVSRITQETIAGDWALECGLLMSYEDSQEYAKVMFPDKDWQFVALPWPLRDADTEGNNSYIASLIAKENMRGLFTVRPEFSIETIERLYVEGGFVGFKPYPYMASATKGADVSIFDFMPRSQFELANKLHAPVLMHLPRAGRLPDPDNIQEIRSILNNYPNIRLVVAHFGRCFHHDDFKRALELLGEDVYRLWFDTAAVINPKVYDLAFNNLDYRNIIFGTDMPIMLWHGKREWDERGYHNLCREDFSWNTHKYPDDEKNYTYFIYEQLNNILNALPSGSRIRDAVFHDNAEYVYSSAKWLIKSAEYNPERHKELLLIADPEESVLDAYINKCRLYEYTVNGEVLGVAATLTLPNNTIELKNIAVHPSFQHDGIGSRLIKYILGDALYSRLIVGTADASAEALAFYGKNGFKPYARVTNFFIDNYPQPVYDNGRLCRDMIMLEYKNTD